MIFSSIKKFQIDLNINKTDLIFLLIIFLISLLICLNKLIFYNNNGFICNDIPIYLSNSLYYAGMNYNNILPVSYLYSSPVICYLTGILFKLGFVTPISLYFVTSIFELFGSFGFYIFLKNRFKPIFSLMGTIIYLSSNLYISFSSSGMLDCPAIAISVWVLVFLFLAVDKNYKYFLILMPLLIFGIFTRPTVAFLIPMIIIYYLSKFDILNLGYELIFNKRVFKNKIFNYLKGNEFKCISISLFISLFIAGLIIFYHSYVFNLDLPFIYLVKESSNGFAYSKTYDLAYKEDYLYYISNFFEFIAVDISRIFNLKISYILCFFTLAGLLIKFFDIIKNFKFTSYNDNLKFNKKSIILLFLLLLLIICLGFFINYYISIIFILLSLLLIQSLLKTTDINRKQYSFCLINISLLICYFIFITHVNWKISRYFLPMFIPIVYFIVLSIESITLFIKKSLNFNHRYFIYFIENVLPLFLIFIMLFSAYITLINYYDYNYVDDNLFHDTEATSNYLINYDENYLNENISTDRSFRYYNYFLNRDTNFIDNYVQPVELFDESNSKYIFLNESYNFKNFTEIYHHGDSYLYQRY